MGRLAMVAALGGLLALPGSPAALAHPGSPAAWAVPASPAALAPSPVPPTATPAPSRSDSIGDVTVIIVLLRQSDGAPLTPDDLGGAATVIGARLAALPAPGTQITPIPHDRVRIDVGDPSQLVSIRRVATAPGRFRVVAITPDRVDEVGIGRPLPDDVTWDEVVPPGHVAQAAVVPDDLGQPAVDIGLDPEAAEAFDAWAAGNLGSLAALVLDDEVVTLATINASGFDGRLQVSSLPDPARAHELAAILTGGPLPVTAEALTVCPAPAPCPVPSPGPGMATPEPGAPTPEPPSRAPDPG